MGLEPITTQEPRPLPFDVLPPERRWLCNLPYTSSRRGCGAFQKSAGSGWINRPGFNELSFNVGFSLSGIEAQCQNPIWSRSPITTKSIASLPAFKKHPAGVSRVDIGLLERALRLSHSHWKELGSRQDSIPASPLCASFP